MRYNTTIERANDLILAYFTREINTEELNELQEWLLASAKNKASFMREQEIWFSALSADDRKRFDTDAAYRRFRIKTQTIGFETEHKFILKPWMRVAAAVVLLVTVAGSAFWYGSKSISNRFSDIVMEAPLGSRNKVYLPDGTLVWLNAGSKISYSQGYGMNDRKVKLEGEGYFEVTKNAELPFKVATKEIDVQVLGTKFNFRNFEDDTESMITLVEGKVAVDNKMGIEEHFVLKPNQRIVLNKLSGKATLHDFDAQRVTTWTQGILSFDEDKLSDIAREMERTYNVEIEIADDTLKQLRFYGNFVRMDQSIDDVLGMMASTGKFEYTKKDKKIILYKR